MPMNAQVGTGRETTRTRTRTRTGKTMGKIARERS
jgi:hypothetical protein